MVKHPVILWAQSTSEIFLTVELEFMSIESLVIEGDLFKLKGKKTSEDYEADIQFFANLKGLDMRQKKTDRRIEIAIPKEEPSWWPRLLKESTKVPWIKVDFDKWKDREEKDDEEGGVDKLFQKIYKDADDDVRRAMMKSFSESCGTVLSTNWKEISQQKTEIKPPDGMEFKKYDEK